MATISLVQPKDLDGFKLVVDMLLKGQLTNIADLLKSMQEKAPGLLDALKLVAKKILVAIQILIDMLDDSIKDLLKKVGHCLLLF
jgi:hypothetical protein